MLHSRVKSTPITSIYFFHKITNRILCICIFKREGISNLMLALHFKHLVGCIASAFSFARSTVQRYDRERQRQCDGAEDDEILFWIIFMIIILAETRRHNPLSLLLYIYLSPRWLRIEQFINLSIPNISLSYCSFCNTVPFKNIFCREEKIIARAGWIINLQQQFYSVKCMIFTSPRVFHFR